MTTDIPMRRLIRLPGFRELEARLLMDQHGGDNDLHAFKAQCAETIYDVFGTSHAETLFQYPDAYYDGELSEEEDCALEDAEDAHEAKFRTEDMKWDEERVAHLKTLGWDLTDDGGRNPLLITRHVCRVIEAVAQGIAGTAPDADVIDAKEWANGLLRDAKQFRQKKRNDRTS